MKKDRYSGEEEYTFLELKEFAEHLTEKYGGDIHDTYHHPYNSAQAGSLPAILYSWHQTHHAGKRAMEEWFKTWRQHRTNTERTRAMEKRKPKDNLWEMP